jgi:hypothetical protein
MFFRSQTSPDSLAKCIQNLTQSNGSKYTKNLNKEGPTKRVPSASFVPEAGGTLKKTKSELFHFLAAISVQEKGWKLDQTNWYMAANALLESEFWVDVHCLSKFRS